MAIQTINIGNIANDGTGDDLREAFIKVNNMDKHIKNKFSRQIGAVGRKTMEKFIQWNRKRFHFCKIKRT